MRCQAQIQSSKKNLGSFRCSSDATTRLHGVYLCDLCLERVRVEQEVQKRGFTAGADEGPDFMFVRSEPVSDRKIIILRVGEDNYYPLHLSGRTDPMFAGEMLKSWREYCVKERSKLKKIKIDKRSA
jgi:hypothetical protein